jgi:hypothetical protein
MSRSQADTFLSLLCIIAGAILVVLGISPMIIPFLLVVLGVMLINYGLALRNRPPVTILFRHWFIRRFR